MRTQPCDIWFPLLQHEQFHISCMRRCSSNGNVSTFMTYMVAITPTLAVSSFVHEQNFNRTCKHRSRIYMAMKKVRAQAIWHMVPITPTWAVSSFVHAHLTWTRVLRYYNVPSCLLAISFSAHWQMFFKRKCKHRSRIIYLVYVSYDHEKGARSHPYDIRSRAFAHTHI